MKRLHHLGSTDQLIEVSTLLLIERVLLRSICSEVDDPVMGYDVFFSNFISVAGKESEAVVSASSADSS